MLHLFDANTLITANNTYYAIDQVGEYWEWLEHQAKTGNVKMPREIYDEIIAGQNNQKGKKNEDLLLKWIKQPHIKKALVFDGEVNSDLVTVVIEDGYANDLTDTELEVVGRDPFLIAYALEDVNARCVVTTENSSPGKKRQNRKIPDVCNDFGVICHTPFKANRDLGFKTNWKSEGNF